MMTRRNWFWLGAFATVLLLWIVALHGKVTGDAEKLGALGRAIIELEGK